MPVAAVPVIAAGVTAIGGIASAKMQSSAASRAAKLTTDAANASAKLQDDAAKRSLGFTQHQSFLDQVRANAASQGQHKADVAGLRNAYGMSGDTAANQRAEYVSGGRTASKVRGQHTNQMNYLRDMMGYGQPQEALDTFVEPDALRQAALIVPEDQQYTTPVDDSIDPLTGQPRYV